MTRSVLLMGAILLQSLPSTATLGEEDWVMLFDGKTLNGWENLRGGPPRGWTVENGALRYQVPKDKQGGNDLYTKKEYANFVLELESKIVPKGNSGIKYRMQWYGKSYLGPEYQILGDSKREKSGSSKSATGALYALIPVDLTQRDLRPEGEWNKIRIVADGKRIEHWLNGKLVVRVHLDSDEFQEAVAKSKFQNRKNFARNAAGRIMLQDHGSEVWYRNIRIKILLDHATIQGR